MSVQVKPGRWRERGGGIAIVEERSHPALWYQWFGRDSLNWPSLWAADGLWLRPGQQHDHDLVEYLGPEEQMGGEE